MFTALLRRWLCRVALTALPLTTSHGVEYRSVSLDGKRATVCQIDLRREQLELFLHDEAGQPLKSFAGVEKFLAAQSRRLVFAMNAGMYHPGFAPVGLFVQDGRELSPLNLMRGEGNFFLQPNGVFLITTGGIGRVIASSEYRTLREMPRLATQSGPLLLRHGQMQHPFKPDSEHRLIRNGVGVPSPGVALFVITQDPVNFHEFSRLFRDELHCPDALFLDGSVSSLFAPPLGRHDRLIDLGPIIGLTASK